MRRTNVGGLDLKKYLHKALITIGKEAPPEEQQFPGEHHVYETVNGVKKLSHWTGPGTNVNARLASHDPNLINAIGPVDKASKRHDISYNNINASYKDHVIDKNEAIREAHIADDEYIRDLKEVQGIDAFVASKAIALKKMGEELGIVPAESFILSSASGIKRKHYNLLASKLFGPTHLLKCEKNGKGGFLAPLLVPILTSLGTYALDKLVSYLSNRHLKENKGGAIFKKPKNDASDDAKRSYIAKKLDNWPDKNKQIEFLYKHLIEKPLIATK